MLKVEQADRDVAAAITGDEAMAYGMSDLSDAVQRVAKHREDTALPLRELLARASVAISDHAGDMADAGYFRLATSAYGLRDEIDAALSPDTTGGE